MRSALALFGKYPLEGNVKTRLAQGVGFYKATQFYKLCVENIFNEALLLSSHIDIFFFYSRLSDKSKVIKWVPNLIIPIPNIEGDLMYVIENVFKNLFSKGFENVIISSTDVPSLTAGIFEQGFLELRKTKTVIAPDNDGGYYLLGMNAYHKELFDITYSKGKGTYSQTLEKIEDLKLSHTVLPRLTDVDTLDDLKNWRAEQKSMSKLVAYIDSILKEV